MALTDDEKKLARAYNIGYLLNSYEPKLLDRIIKANPKNEFVKAMQVGRDHQEFNVGIPRKDYSREFKNGFHNGRTLSEHQPEMIDRLLTTKGLSKDYKKGLESARKEFSIKQINQKMDRIPKTPPKDLRQDLSFQKGFNTGYRLGAGRPLLVGHLQRNHDKYSNYLEGIKLGQEQHSYDLQKLQEKNPNATLFPGDPKSSRIEQSLVEHKMIAMNDISDHQLSVMNRAEAFPDVPAPKWMLEKTPDNDAEPPEKDKGIDLER